MSAVKYQIVSQPLESPNIIAILSAFRDLCKSSIGPCGRLKILVTGGGFFIITSSSTRILNYLPLDSPLCLFIAQIMKSQLAEFKDNGLYIGVLSSSLLIQLLSQNAISTVVLTGILQQVCDEISRSLNYSKIQIDFSTVKQLLPVVKSIVQSKPSCCLTKSEECDFVITIVKAFLDSASDKSVGDIVVVAGDDSGSTISTFPGVLYQSGLFQSFDIVMNSFTSHSNDKMYSLLLFNIMLSEEKPEKRREVDRIALNPDYPSTYDLATAMQVMKSAVELGVHIVACQKVVHPYINLFLRRNGILLLDRMGTHLTEHVEKLSGAVPISNIKKCVNKEMLLPLLGHVSSVRCLKQGKKNYITLERNDRNVTTLLVSGINAEASAEIKVCVNQAIQSLRQLLLQPFILPGAGCMEMTVIASIAAKISSAAADCYLCSKSQLQSALLIVQKSLLAAAGFSTSSLVTMSADTAYYHAWDSTDSEGWSNCRCGLVTAAMVQDAGKNWVNLDWNSRVIFSNCATPMILSVNLLHGNAILDVFSCKYNAMKLSLECFSSLAGIGLILCKTTE